MSMNQEIASRLHLMAALLELTGADSFRASAHARAARAIDDLTVDLGEIAGDRKRLLAIEGIGPKIADKIAEFAATGRVREVDELAAQVPAGLLEVMRVPGMGPKTVRAVWQTLGVTDLASLRRAIEDGSILTVPRMGKKAAENIKAALAFIEESGSRARLGEAQPLAETIVARMRALPGVKRAEFAGSMRRGRDTVGDVDVVVAASKAAGAAAGESFRAMQEVRQVLAAGETKSSVRASMGGGRAIQVDLRVVQPASFGAALLYFTGSKEHNVRLRQRALSMGMTLNEYGLFPEDGEKAPPQERGVRAVAAETEEGIYRALGLPMIPPELREDHGETSLPVDHDFGLIEIGQIRAELHAHTTASDGSMSIEELAAEAKARGFHTIAVTDHSKSQPLANGLTVERLAAHVEAIRAAARRVEGIAILAGSEVDILPDGSLDYDDQTLHGLDIVVASPHAALKQEPGAATERLVRAASHPLVHIIGHPTGRLINAREGLSPDIGAVARAAAASGTALEINANSHRLDLRAEHVRMALEAGASIAIDCDVHTRADFEQLRFGVATARRGGLTAERCVNAWPAERLRAWLASKR